MKKFVVCSAMMASLAAFAGSAGAEGTDWVVTAEAGETYTIGTAIGNYARLVKRGAGEVVLTAATTAFAGEVVIETGTLTISNKTAVGSSAPIEVKSGATLWLKLPGTGQSSSSAFPHDVTIAGKGVGGNGALRFTNTGSSNGDSLLNKLTLLDDATIDVSSRWGMFDGKVIELNGHTLTRIGKNNWMMYGILRSTGGPGEVNNVYGLLTFQLSPVIEENVTVVVTNLDSSSYIGLWGASMGSSKGTIKVYNGRYIQAQSGNAQTSNHIGPLHLAGNDGSVTLYPQYNSTARAMSVDGAVTSDSGVGLTVNGKGSVWFNNDVTVSGKSYITGGGSVWFNKDVTVNDNLYIQGGNVCFCGANSARSVKLVMQSGSTATQEDGNTYVRMLRIANGGATSGAFRQLGGVFAVASGDNGRIGESNGSRGYYTLEGGEAHVSNTTYMAEWKGSFGAFRQTGGLFDMKRNDATDLTFFLGRAGSGLFVQTGGTNDLLAVRTSQNGGVQMGTNALCEATISGTGTLFRTSLFQMGATGSICTNILNIKDGAVVKANRFRKLGVGEGTHAYVNVDGGTLMPTFAWGWTAASGDVYARSPDHFVVWKKGLVFDTSENAANSGTGSTEIPFWFESPTGKGVESVALPTESGFVATNYMGIARVVFEDATGWGASAYAEYDFTQKKVTKIVVTSRGCNYSDNAKAYLESPARSARYECALTLSSNEGQCGEFVKRGTPTLNLYATNTITGGIAVESGALVTCTGGVIPSNTPVRVESGATLNLNSKGDITVSTFTGAGQVINGAVTVTNAVRASCAELFAGKHATFAGNLTFAPGATFTITDPENLAAYSHSPAVTAFTARRVVGAPRLAFEGDVPPGSGTWSLAAKGDGRYTFGPVVGTLIMIK